MEKKNGRKNNKHNTIDMTMLMQLLALHLKLQIELTSYELESVRDWNTRHEKGERDDDGNSIAQFDEGISCFGEDFTKEWI
ncbi:hypothetical protein OAC38_00560 [Candidatus Poseidoniaceae archaeon]|nr:hypothetical protein [Candidatus Poseidoniaceae archaeon]